jgi:hypothetical protein
VKQTKAINTHRQRAEEEHDDKQKKGEKKIKDHR